MLDKWVQIYDLSHSGGYLMSASLPDALWAQSQRLIEQGSTGRTVSLRFKLLPLTGARCGLAIRRSRHARAAAEGCSKDNGKLDPPRILPKLLRRMAIHDAGTGLFFAQRDRCARASKRDWQARLNV